MPHPVEITEDHTPQLYDSATGDSLETEKVIDIGDVTARRAFLLFTRARRGRIAQIVCPYPGEEFMGLRLHFFVDELDSEMSRPERDDTFGMTASDLGLSKERLRELIVAEAPR